MATSNLERKKIQEFVELAQNNRIKSTKAEKVTVTDDLYNVDGSSDDPLVPGSKATSWLDLLEKNGITGNCYVTNCPAPPNKSHPNDYLGGHMTTDPDGKVIDGGSCYLMPLCKWHNNTARNKQNFKHQNKDNMLELSGYMEDELAVTFMIRLPSNKPYALLYDTGEGWAFEDLSEEQAENLEAEVFSKINIAQTKEYVLIQRIGNDQVTHIVRDCKLTSNVPTKNFSSPNRTVNSSAIKESIDLKDAPPAMSPTDMLYQAFSNLYGNKNPRQLFSLVWPGTVLEPQSFTSDGSTPGSILSSVAQSKLFDQHYPIATITQPDGTKVSDRYQQAINQYGPIPNKLLAQLQALMQERLSKTTQMNIDGQVVTMSVLDQYSYLSGLWNVAKQNWAQLQASKLAELEASGAKDWWSQYVIWYALVAPAQIQTVNAAHDRLLAEFPLTQYQDAIAILSIQEATALLNARNDLTRATVVLPEQLGSNVVLSSAFPGNWGDTLTPSTTFIDLLSSPDAQQAALNNTISFLQQQIYAWNAVLAQIPAGSAADIQNALDGFNTASSAYNDTITKLLISFTNNAVLAVQIYAEVKGGDDDEKTKGVNETLDGLNKQNPPKEPKTTSLTKEQIKEIATQVGAAQNSLIGANASMVSAGTDLARKATQLLQTQAGAPLKSMIMPIIDQLNSQLQQVQAQSAAMLASCVKAVMLMGKGNKTAPADFNNPEDCSRSPEMPEASAGPQNLNWQYVTIDLDTKSMNQSSQTSTFFSQMNWSVDLFFGSAGGQSTEQSSEFASKYLGTEGKVKIGMLATKVLIQRDWMHPEIFNMSKNYFRINENPVTTPDSTASGFKEWSRGQLLASELGGDVNTSQATNATIAINKGPFPAYPVALLLAKDITISIQCNVNETTALSKQSQSNSTQGGGFLCFSVSKTQSSSSNINQAGSYAMAGNYTFRIAAPQVIGAWLQISPNDDSSKLDTTLAADIAGAIGFVTNLQNAASTPRARLITPVRPA